MPPTNRPFTVRFTPAAAEDLEVACSYVSDRNQTAARALLERLEDAARRLGEFPDMGSPLSAEKFDFVAPGIRFLTVEPYVMFYRLSESEIAVLRVLHMRQDSLGELLG